VVLEAGLHEFISAQYLEANLSSVARRAGMSNSSVYYHFSSKEELWLELHSIVTQSLLDQIALTDETGVLQDKAKRVVRRFIDWMQGNAQYALFYSTYSGGNASTEAARRSDALRVTRMIAAKLASSGQAGSGEPDISVQLWVAAVTTEVLFRELCLATSSGVLDIESVGTTGDLLIAKIVATVPSGTEDHS
jgi:AcrR family transcriptional regulator